MADLGNTKVKLMLASAKGRRNFFYTNNFEKNSLVGLGGGGSENPPKNSQFQFENF